MPNFFSNSLHIGTVKQFSVTPLAFLKTPECKNIVSLVAGCGCTTPSNEADRVSVQFHAGSIPPQSLPVINVRKRITVTFDDSSQEILEFFGSVEQ